MTGALIFWASAFPAIRVGLRGFDPAALALTRFALTSAILGSAAAVSRPRRPRRADLGRIAAASWLLLVAYNLGLNYGERHIGAGASSLLIATAPLFTAVIA
jgi:drug/metabolite transporter (DMT)-like permease